MIDHDLRDMMAAAALQGMLSYSHVNPATGNWQENALDVAKRAYEYADAMVAERWKRVIFFHALEITDRNRRIAYVDSFGTRHPGTLKDWEPEFLHILIDGHSETTKCRIDHCRWGES